MFSDPQQQLRQQIVAAPVLPAPAPWSPAGGRSILSGGVLGIGFGVHPDRGQDLVLVVSHNGLGLFDPVTGERVARDQDADPQFTTAQAWQDLSCPGIGPIAGTRVRIAGLFGGGLHTLTADGWAVEVVSVDWPNHRVLLLHDGGLQGDQGEGWWHIYHADISELRAAGFSPSGRTLAVATTSDLTLWTRPAPASGGT